MHYSSCFFSLCHVWICLYLLPLFYCWYQVATITRSLTKNSVLKEVFGFHQCYNIVNSYVTLSREHSGHALSCRAPVSFNCGYIKIQIIRNLVEAHWENQGTSHKV